MSESIDERDRLTFWRNWYEAIRYKPNKERLAKYDALLDYVFEGVEPEKPTAEHPETADAYEIVNFVRATVAKSRVQRQNGMKPKRTKDEGEAKRKPNGSQTEAKRKPNGSQTEAEAKQEQEQEQVQEQEQEQYAKSISASARARVGKTPPTISQFEGMAGVAGVPVEFARQLHAELEASGWVGADGLPVRNAMIFLKSAWNSQKKSSAARVNDNGLDVASMATNGAARADGTFACPGIDD